MRKSWSDASRRDAVREAAASWHEAGAIDAKTLAAVEAEYPGPPRRLALVWRVLVFVLVSIAANAVFASVFVFAGSRGIGVRCAIFGLALAAATEALRGSRLRGTGSDAAASFWAASYLVGGVALLLAESFHLEERRVVTLCLLSSFLVLAAACWRWGYEAYGVLAATALFFFLARFPSGRLIWIAAASLAMPVCSRLIDAAAIPPPHRRSFAGVLAVSAAALYAAVNRYSIDERLVEKLRDSAQVASVSSATRALANLATALLPLFFLGWGIRTRRTLIVDLGAAFAALSLVTLRHYVYLAPLWAILLACGAALVLLALALNRALRRAPGAAIGGFTASPLYAGKKAEGLQAAAVVAGFAPEAPVPAGRNDFGPGGGRFGGGGATGEY